jgi:CBS domain-containing protein
MLKENNVGCLIVENDGKLCGILTDRDIALKVTGEQKEPRTTKVAEVMTRDPVRISIDKDMQHLTSLMHTFHVRRVPVVDGYDTTLGIITLDDLIALLGDEMSEIGKAISEEFPEGNA